jgi:hypothetical protein
LNPNQIQAKEGLMRNALKNLVILAAATSAPTIADAAQIVTPLAQSVTSYSVEDGIAYKFRANLIQGSIYQLAFTTPGDIDSFPTNSIDVSVHGKIIYSVIPTGSVPQEHTTTFKYFGDNSILFSGMSSQGPSTGIDNVRVSLVSVSSVPEPATWAMLLLGVGMTGGVMRAKRRRRGEGNGLALPAN